MKLSLKGGTCGVARPSVQYFWLGMAYNCLSAKRYHSSIELITDDTGFAVVHKCLNIPYSHISTAFNELAARDHKLWAVAKLSAYKHQTQPFVHIDNDVYLWQGIPYSSKADLLVAQNKIHIPKGYRDTLASVLQHFQHVPECIKKRGVPKRMSIISGGIVGGNDIDFFQEYCSIADAFLKQNEQHLNKLDMGLFNAILDEYLFTCLVAEQKRKVRLLLNVPLGEGFSSIVQFNLVPLLSKYIHLVGFAKQNRFACEQIELRFRYEFPAEYKRINRTLHDLYPDCYDGYLVINPERWQKAKAAFNVVYNAGVDDLVRRKVKLSDGVEILQTTQDDGEELMLQQVDVKTGIKKMVALQEMNEALVYFQSPVCIQDLLEGLKADGFITDDESLATYRFKLLDFVMEKIIIEGILEFA